MSAVLPPSAVAPAVAPSVNAAVTAPVARSARRAPGGAALALVLLLLALVLWLLGTGVGSTGLESLWPALWGQGSDPAAHAMAQQIVREIRLPRTLGAWCAGALLGLAGVLVGRSLPEVGIKPVRAAAR